MAALVVVAKLLAFPPQTSLQKRSGSLAKEASALESMPFSLLVMLRLWALPLLSWLVVVTFRKENHKAR